MGATEILNFALGMWNGKVEEVWRLITTSPKEFMGGGIWDIVVNINGVLQAVGYSLLILFFAMSIFQQVSNLKELRRPELAFGFLIRFVVAKSIITYGMQIMLWIFGICNGIVLNVIGSLGSAGSGTALPAAIVTAIESAEFFESLFLTIIALIAGLVIIIQSFILLLTVYARFFNIFIYTALAPIPLSTFGGEMTSGTGRAFVKSYTGVCLQAAVIVLACIIYSGFVEFATPATPAPGDSVFTMIFTYLVSVILNMLVLLGLVKGSDHIVQKMMAL